MPTVDTNIERLFFTDVKQKKTTASGIRGRASRLGRVGSRLCLRIGCPVRPNVTTVGQGR
ncbi:hypothetical protein GJ688_18360 [Heliobacillus mobilis]|uniref:Uncharacterized protein n=1 Tax=Heliobacterium mobile TaxID=28064 RepID=A0A6I3SS56_HELMO|nr:hypothetical protein [Heliobacterium mobile]MTV50887.1 hypothetical protein [Heliobacterium mobile]